jgi:hypothetical protein
MIKQRVASSDFDIQAPNLEEGKSLESIIMGENNNSNSTHNGGKVLIESYKEKDGYYQRIFKLVFCFLGLQISYVLWGIAQEQIMTTDYKGGKFKSSAVS